MALAAPTGLTISASGYSVTVTWNAVSGATDYRVSVNGVTNNTTRLVQSPSYSYTGSPGTQNINVVATDRVVNSPQSATVSVSLPAATAPTGDTTAPSVPSLSVYAAGSYANVSWNYDPDVTLYELRRGGSSLSTLATTAYNEYLPDGTYYYNVRARDAAGNWSSFSSNQYVTIQSDVTPPAVPTVTTSMSGSTVTVSWGAISDANLYEVFRNGVSQGTTTSTSFSQTAADGSYTYSVRARDAAGNWSSQSSGTSTTVDTTPPTVPSTPQGSSTSAKRATLSWPAVVDAVSYVILRNGVQVGTSTVPSFEDTLSVGGTYTYTIQAKDSANNTSSVSAGIVIQVAQRDTLHAPEAVMTFDHSQLDYTVGQRIFVDEDNIRFDRE